jgi:hypothetical protein
MATCSKLVHICVGIAFVCKFNTKLILTVDIIISYCVLNSTL